MPDNCGTCSLAGGICKLKTETGCLRGGDKWQAIGSVADPNPCGVVMCPGDLNCGGNVTFADIGFLVGALAGQENWPPWPCPWRNGVGSGDNDATVAGIGPFVARMGTACP